VTDNEKMIELAERLESKAKYARKTECVPEYQAYWRGYAVALEEATDMVRARASSKGTGV
jgi:hypothetical protein